MIAHKIQKEDAAASSFFFFILKTNSVLFGFCLVYTVVYVAYALIYYCHNYIVTVGTTFKFLGTRRCAITLIAITV